MSKHLKTKSGFGIFLFAAFILSSCAEQTHHNASTQTAFAKTQQGTTNQTIAGKKEGLWQTYHPGGSLKKEGNYVNDLLGITQVDTLQVLVR